MNRARFEPNLYSHAVLRDLPEDMLKNIKGMLNIREHMDKYGSKSESHSRYIWLSQIMHLPIKEIRRREKLNLLEGV